MSDALRTQIYNTLIVKDTEDLLKIWQGANTTEWNEEVFEIIKELLIERLGYVPPQPIEKQVPQILRNIERHVDRNELDQAISQCELAFQIDPHSAIAYNYLGEIYDQKGDLELAITNYQRAVQRDDELEEAWENLLSLEAELEEKFEGSDAKQHLDQALEYAYNDEPEKALEECETARSILPNIALAYNYLGMILETLSQLEPAIASYIKAVQFNPRFYAARENLANARVRLEEEQYLRTANQSLAEIQNANEMGAAFAESMAAGGSEEGVPIPGWWYLDANAFLLRGWPGHRIRPGRTGYDPLDRDFELAHMEGVVIHQLLILRFRTRNPIYLLLMMYLGLTYSIWPLLCMYEVLQGNMTMTPLMIIYFPYLVIGVMFLINIFLSLKYAFLDEYDEAGPVFF